MKTVIMAGGKGTRISSIASNVPKPMILLEGKPVLEREIVCLRNQGFTDLIITVSHMAEQITDYFGDGSKFGVKIEYFVEKQPLGNAGALFKMQNILKDDFLLLNADSIFDIDFNRLVDYHKSKGGLATIFTHPNSHPYDSGVIVAKEDNSVDKWLAKEDVRPQWYHNCVNAGIHVINPAVLDLVEIDASKIGTAGQNGEIIKVDLDRQLLKPLCGTGKMFCYSSPEYVKDMGTPDRFNAVCSDYKRGIVRLKNLRNKQKAIFLDRDGTINKYVGFLKSIDEFELLPRVAEAIKRINSTEYLVIVATNQPVISRGDLTASELQLIHNKMETLLGEEGAYIDGLYYCPHHPHKGFKGEIPELKIVCDCRKPKPGLLLKAAKDYNIDLSKSWMVGDSENDIKAGISAGCRTALLGNGNYNQDVTVSSLEEFVSYLLRA